MAEPERNPRAVRALCSPEEFHAARHRAIKPPLDLLRDQVATRQPCAQGVCGEVWTAAVKRQRAPPAAERRDAAVAILEIHQPARGPGRRLARERTVRSE